MGERYKEYDVMPQGDKEKTFYEEVLSSSKYNYMGVFCIGDVEKAEIFHKKGVAIVIETDSIGDYYLSDVILIGNSKKRVEERIKEVKSNLEEDTGFKLEEIK